MTSLESRNKALSKLMKYGQKTKTLVSAVDGIKYVGKIKLIKKDEMKEDVELQENLKRTKSLSKNDLTAEFEYRNEMDESVAERLSMFQKKEQEQLQREMKIGDAGRKKISLRGIPNPVSSQPKGEPEYVKRERDIADEVERIFKQHKDGLLSTPKQHQVFSGKIAATSSPSNSSRSHSDDSGLVEEDNMGNGIIDHDKERRLMDQAEEMFQNFSLQHKQMSNNKESHLPEKRQTHSSHDKNGILVRLELAEKRAETAKEAMRICKLNRSFEDSLDAEETYYTHALEISRLKKRLLAIETPATQHAAHQDMNRIISSRECKFASKKDGPPVDKSMYNEDGDCVPEGITTHRMQVFQK